MSSFLKLFVFYPLWASTGLFPRGIVPVYTPANPPPGFLLLTLALLLVTSSGLRFESLLAVFSVLLQLIVASVLLRTGWLIFLMLGWITTDLVAMSFGLASTAWWDYSLAGLLFFRSLNDLRTK